MNNLLPVIASGHLSTFIIRWALLLLLLFFVGLLVVEMVSFIQLFQVDVLRVPSVGIVDK